jgi:hypothetical protein
MVGKICVLPASLFQHHTMMTSHEVTPYFHRLQYPTSYYIRQRVHPRVVLCSDPGTEKSSLPQDRSRSGLGPTQPNIRRELGFYPKGKTTGKRNWPLTYI